MNRNIYSAKRRSTARAVPRPVRSTYTARPTRNMQIRRVVEFPPFIMSQTANVWNKANYSFRLVDVPSYGELAALFDQYRLLKVKLTWIPQFKDIPVDPEFNIGAGTPIIYITKSDDGTQNLNDKLDAFQDSHAIRIDNCRKNFSITVTPHVQLEVQTSLAIAGAAPKTNVWLDTANPSVTHYGAAIGGYIPQAFGSLLINTNSFTIQCEYFMEFKNPK